MGAGDRLKRYVGALRIGCRRVGVLFGQKADLDWPSFNASMAIIPCVIASDYEKSASS